MIKQKCSCPWSSGKANHRLELFIEKDWLELVMNPWLQYAFPIIYPYFYLGFVESHN